MKKSVAFLLSVILTAACYAGKPKISFFTELPSREFVSLFSDSLLIEQLSEMKAELRIGLLDLTPERAKTISMLNAAGIPVTAWLLLPEDEGYWFNATNGNKAAARYENFKSWSAEHGLLWQGIGL
nr:hypothetical protein [Bacteroidales bacterium]